MAVRALPEPLHVWRIGDPEGRFPIYSGEGAALTEGRWHCRGQNVIYTSGHYGTAMLEKLACYNGILPPGQHFLKIDIPAGGSYEEVTKDSLTHWDRADGKGSRAFGSRWLDEVRSCLLVVPSVVSREECNILINPDHPGAKSIRPGREKPVRWDNRLF